VVVRSGLVAEAGEAWRAALGSAGFRKRSGDVYTRQVAEDVLGWLGLNRAVNRGDGLLEVNPVVGVRHQVLEPSGALDSAHAEAVMRMIRTACKRGIAAVVVTHDVQLAAWADRVVLIRDGHVVNQATPVPGPEPLPGRDR
jgi:ABC-type branched-subunit amino acid transport system ATPase component